MFEGGQGQRVLYLFGTAKSEQQCQQEKILATFMFAQPANKAAVAAVVVVVVFFFPGC